MRQGVEPVTLGLFGALGSRYKLRGKFKNDIVHMMEIAPFAIMPDGIRVRRLAEYLLVDEIPDRIAIDYCKADLNAAMLSPSDENGDVALDFLTGSAPILLMSGIRWLSRLSEENKSRIMQALENEIRKERD